MFDTQESYCRICLKETKKPKLPLFYTWATAWQNSETIQCFLIVTPIQQLSPHCSSHHHPSPFKKHYSYLQFHSSLLIYSSFFPIRLSMSSYFFFHSVLILNFFVAACSQVRPFQTLWLKLLSIYQTSFLFLLNVFPSLCSSHVTELGQGEACLETPHQLFLICESPGRQLQPCNLVKELTTLSLRFLNSSRNRFSCPHSPFI